MHKTITIEAVIEKDIKTVWSAWTLPEHITKWAFASDGWECPRAENDVQTGGRFMTRMQAKDGSAGFDFGGVYTAVEEGKHIAYTMDGEDARKVTIDFTQAEGGVRVVETFDMESENSEELQRGGWQSILNNFKKYAENL